MNADVEMIAEIWQLPYEERRFVLQDKRDEWGEDRFFVALWKFAKGYKK